MTSPRPLLRRVAILAVVLLLSLVTTGCAKFAYSRLDTFASWYIGNLVTLEAQQRHDLREWLGQTLQWHRESELRRYAQLLTTLRDEVATPGDRSRYERFETQIESFGEAVVARAAPEAARLLASLSPSQIVEFDRNLEARSLERAADDLKAIDKGKWEKERARDLRRQLKRWTGRVTEEQQALIDEGVARLTPTTNAWLESQRQWRSTLVETLNDRNSSAGVEQRLLELLQRPNAHWTSGYAAQSERNREQWLTMLEALDKSLMAPQRQRLQSELTKLADQINALIEH